MKNYTTLPKSKMNKSNLPLTMEKTRPLFVTGNVPRVFGNAMLKRKADRNYLLYFVSSSHRR